MKTFTAPFAQTPKTAAVVVTGAAPVTGDTPANIVELLTAGTEGAVVTSISAAPRGTVTATSLCLWLQKSGRPEMFLVDSALMAAHTVEATTAIPVTGFARIADSEPLRLEAGDKLFVGSQVALAAGIVFTAQWMDY